VPSLGPGEYRVSIEPRPRASSGANDFWWLRLDTASELPAEAEAPTAPGANDTVATAEPLVGPGVLAHIGSPVDVDYFAIHVGGGHSVAFDCFSPTIGSGVVGMSAELRDGTDAVLAHAAETSSADAAIVPFQVPTAGTYYLRLSATGQDATNEGTWARCTVSVS
jgi:hypothetical protein